MKILMVCNGAYPDEIGGVHTYVYELAKHLTALGHRLTILTRRVAPELPSEEIVDGIRYVRYEYRDSDDPLRWRYRLYWGARKMFDTLAAQEDFDVIHGHWPHSTAGVFEHPGSRWALKVYTFHAPLFEEEQIEASVLRRERPFTVRGALKRLWVPISLYEKRRREQKVLEQCSLVLVLSGFMRQRAIGCFGVPPQRMEIIPGGVDTRRFCPADNRQAIRLDLGIPADKRLLLTIRRLVPRMGLHNLVKAMVTVKQPRPQAFLCIGGTGVLDGDLNALIAELGLAGSARLLGFVPNDRLADWYRAADYFVMPTEFLEGFGLATLEAMACGTPALGTPVGGTGEILGNIDNALLFSGSAPHSIAEGILRHLDNDGAGELRRKVARHVRKTYSWETVALWVEGLLHEKLRAEKERRR